MARREYQGAATPTTITGSITNSATSLTLTSSTGWPTGSFSFVIDPGLAGEEKVLATSRSGATVTITTRGYDGTTAASHNAGAVIYPVPSAIDFDEANSLVSGITAGTGIAMAGSTSGSTLLKSTAVAGSTTVTIPAATDTLVGKATTDVLTNKDLTSGTNTFPTTLATLASPTFTGTVTIPAGTTSSAAVAGYMGIPQNATTTGAYTVTAADDGKNIRASATRTVTIDSNANLALPIGFATTFTTDSGATMTIAITTDTMNLSPAGTTGSRTLAPYGMATAIKQTTTTWLISGSGLT